MTEQPQTNEATPEQPESAPDAAQAAADTHEQHAEALYGEDKPEEQEAEPEKKPEEAGQEDGEKGEESEAEGDKAEYGDFDIPEDIPARDEDVTALKEIGQEYKLPQEALQKLVDLQVNMQKRAMEDYSNLVKEWKSEMEADPEIGGDKLKDTIDKANKAVQLIGDDQLVQDLTEIGLGNRASFARAMLKVHELNEAKTALEAKVQRLTGEDSMEDTAGGQREQKLPPEKILYPDMA